MLPFEVYFLVTATVAQVVDDRVDNFLNRTSRLHFASHCLLLVEISEILTQIFPRGEILTFLHANSTTSCDAI